MHSASFLGEAVTVFHGKVLQSRGRRILEAILTHLQTASFGLGSVDNTEVLLSGCSAGGLAAILNADRVRALLPAAVTKFRVLAGSGFFLDAPNVDGEAVYGRGMRRVFTMQNTSATLSRECQAAQPSGSEWRCILGTSAAQFVRAPAFLITSALDLWQLMW